MFPVTMMGVERIFHTPSFHTIWFWSKRRREVSRKEKKTPDTSAAIR